MSVVHGLFFMKKLPEPVGQFWIYLIYFCAITSQASHRTVQNGRSLHHPQDRCRIQLP